ncbi:hypothetical protein GGR53DRAFT_491891 [Hypoxylon sp. FL1150]|nr:hypothetical protein GGR53DRAFT_491891 [Hypoxylon sp. FL1150]
MWHVDIAIGLVQLKMAHAYGLERWRCEIDSMLLNITIDLIEIVRVGDKTESPPSLTKLVGRVFKVETDVLKLFGNVAEAISSQTILMDLGPFSMRLICVSKRCLWLFPPPPPKKKKKTCGASTEPTQDRGWLHGASSRFRQKRVRS